MDLRQAAVPLYEARGWMKLLGVVMVLSGILTALTLVGLLVAWLPIWLGVLLFQAAGRVESAVAADDALSLRESLAKLKTFFVVQGILLLICLVGTAVAMLVGGLSLAALLS